MCIICSALILRILLNLDYSDSWGLVEPVLIIESLDNQYYEY